MVRQNTERGSPFYAAFVTPTNKLVVEYRTAFAGAANVAGSIQIANHSRYLEIQRTGDQFRAAFSTDGANYTLVPGSTVTLALPEKTLEGLFSNSGVNADTRGSYLHKCDYRNTGECPHCASSSHDLPKELELR